MVPRARLRIAVAALVLALGGCGRDNPAAPSPHDIAGPVILVGYLVDDTGRLAGTRVIGDADGIRVELVGAAGVIASTLTVHGRYTFHGVPPGAYVARAGIAPEVSDATTELTVANRDVVSGDTLRLRSQGDLLPIPNPFHDRVICWFDMPDTEDISVRVLDISGTLLHVPYEGQMLPGLHWQFWDGVDRQGEPVSPGIYWFTVRDAHGTRAHLVFRE